MFFWCPTCLGEKRGRGEQQQRGTGSWLVSVTQEEAKGQFARKEKRRKRI